MGWSVGLGLLNFVRKQRGGLTSRTKVFSVPQSPSYHTLTLRILVLFIRSHWAPMNFRSHEKAQQERRRCTERIPVPGRLAGFWTPGPASESRLPGTEHSEPHGAGAVNRRRHLTLTPHRYWFSLFGHHVCSFLWNIISVKPWDSFSSFWIIIGCFAASGWREEWKKSVTSSSTFCSVNQHFKKLSFPFHAEVGRVSQLFWENVTTRPSGADIFNMAVRRAQLRSSTDDQEHAVLWGSLGEAGLCRSCF